jgi:hypothetical protein
MTTKNRGSFIIWEKKNLGKENKPNLGDQFLFWPLGKQSTSLWSRYLTILYLREVAANSAIAVTSELWINKIKLQGHGISHRNLRPLHCHELCTGKNSASVTVSARQSGEL